MNPHDQEQQVALLEDLGPRLALRRATSTSGGARTARVHRTPFPVLPDGVLDDELVARLVAGGGLVPLHLGATPVDEQVLVQLRERVARRTSRRRGATR